MRTIFDFGDADAIGRWVSVNDAVMGGRSSGRLEPTAEGTALFCGHVSLENGGGFASVRSRPDRHDLRDHPGLGLRLLGDGRRYKLNLKTDRERDDVLYRVAFDTQCDEWQTPFLPFEEFQPTFRGRLVASVPALDPSRVVSFGLMISDRQQGPFRLELAWLAACRP